MKIFFLLLAIICFTAIGHAQTPAWLWAKGAGGSGGVDLGLSTAVDGAGNSYVTGSFISSTITFGGTTFTNTGYSNIFVVKYDIKGNIVWATSIGGSGSIGGYNGQLIAVDGAGNCYVTGTSISPSITFGGPPLLVSGHNIFVAKYDVNGNFVWAKISEEINYVGSTSIAVDGAGNSYVTGAFVSSITFGSTTLTGNNFGNIFVVKFDRDGNVVLAMSSSSGGGSGDHGGDCSQSIAVDGAGNSYVTGFFGSPTMTFGSTTLNNRGSLDIFTVMYDANGNALWAKSAGGSSEDWAYGIGVDWAGNCYVTGYFASSSIMFDTKKLNNTTGENMFVVKYDASGNVLWATSATGSSQVQGQSIVVDGAGDSYVTGWFYGSSATFGSRPPLTNSGGNDIFVVKYDASGDAIWATSAGGTGEDVGYGIGVDGTGNCYVTGLYQVSCTFGGTTLTNGNSGSVFVAKLGMAVDSSYSCPGNLVANGGFSSGLVPGAINGPGHVDSWIGDGYESNPPIMLQAGGCETGDMGSLGMLGTSGSGLLGAAQQTLASGFVAGTTYSITMCVRNPPPPSNVGNIAALMPYVRFKFRSSNGPVQNASDGELIGETDPVTSANWATVTLSNWTCLSSGSILTISAFNDGGGAFPIDTSYGEIDRVCITSVSCAVDTLRLNTGFNQAASSIDPPGSLDLNWKVVCEPAGFAAGAPMGRPAAVVLTPDPYWHAPFANSQWLSAHPSSADQINGNYCFVDSFCVEDTSNASLNMQLFVDDSANVYLNGFLIGSTPPEPRTCNGSNCNFETAHTFTATSSQFLPGINELRVVVENVYGVAMGFDIAGTVAAGGGANITQSCCDSSGEIGGFKWNDLNGDGLYQPNEPPMSNSPVQLSNGTTTTTDQYGYYFFNNVLPGTYTVRDLQQLGWVLTYPVSPSTYPVVLGRRQVIDSLNFGYQQHPETLALSVRDRWNLVSVPLSVNNPAKSAVFPNAISATYAYQGSYVQQNTLINGKGYWLKFSGAQNDSVTGYVMTHDSIVVQAGWNLIGSISLPIPVNTIGSPTDGLTLSQFFGYANGYTKADTIQPGKGYWVKANMSGTIVLSAPSWATAKQRIRIVPSDELPPPPPVTADNNEPGIPKVFALSQNYPNPFNPTTVINYQLPDESYVRLALYNVLGQEVRLLVNQPEQAGYKSVQFDANSFSSGIYFYRLDATSVTDPSKHFSQTRKMLLIK
ncbi:MAG: SdrD B-like domain-containing protein [Bacteroidota bacterium]